MKSALIFAEDLYEDMELWYPKIRLTEANHRVIIAGPEKGKVYKGKHGYPVTADVSFDQVKVEEFDALIIPGGYAPDLMRRSPKAVELVRTFDQQKKIVAAICHAGWMLCSAKILKGRDVTCYIAIKDDVENAGANFKDAEVIIDNNLITSRTPADLPAFLRTILQQLG